MKRLIIGSLALALSFTAAACSDDSSSSGSTTGTAATAGDGSAGDGTSASDIVLGEQQQAVLDKTLAQVADAGLVADEACMRELIAQLSDADAALILSIGPGETVTASPDGEAIGQQIINCVSTGVTATT